MNPIAAPLQALLDDLDRVSRVHEEVGDTDVREHLHAVIHAAFFWRQSDYEVPGKLGMLSGAGNAAVRDALQRFIAATASAPLDDPADRLSAFQDPEVCSASGNAYDEYFGHADALEVMEAKGPLPATLEGRMGNRAKPWWKFWS